MIDANQDSLLQDVLNDLGTKERVSHLEAVGRLGDRRDDGNTELFGPSVNAANARVRLDRYASLSQRITKSPIQLTRPRMPIIAARPWLSSIVRLRSLVASSNESQPRSK